MGKAIGCSLSLCSSPQLVRQRLKKEKVSIPVEKFGCLQEGDIYFWSPETLQLSIDGFHPIMGRGCDHFFIKLSSERVHGIWICENGDCCLCSSGTYVEVVPTKERLVVPVRALPQFFPSLVYKFDIDDL